MNIFVVLIISWGRKHYWAENADVAAKSKWFLGLLQKRFLGQEVHLMFKYVPDAETLQLTFWVVSAHVSYQI